MAEPAATDTCSVRLATIQLSGLGWEPEDAVRAFAAEPATLWRVGDRCTRGRSREDTGCSFRVSNASSAEQLMRDVAAFLATHAASLAGFTRRDLRAVLHIGVRAGDPQPYTATLRFPTEVLRALSDLRVSLHLAAYPSSDEA
jgi:hypothetical protein